MNTVQQRADSIRKAQSELGGMWPLGGNYLYRSTVRNKAHPEGTYQAGGNDNCDDITTMYGSSVVWEFVCQRHEFEAFSAAAQRDQLRDALESLILFTKPTKSNAVALNNAHSVLNAVRGTA